MKTSLLCTKVNIGLPGGAFTWPRYTVARKLSRFRVPQAGCNTEIDMTTAARAHGLAVGHLKDTPLYALL